jgi:hypothetical protein
MESAMAVDYPGEWEGIWSRGHCPYFIHFAGNLIGPDIPISRLFYDFLSQAEREEWAAIEEEKSNSRL